MADKNNNYNQLPNGGLFWTEPDNSYTQLPNGSYVKASDFAALSKEDQQQVLLRSGGGSGWDRFKEGFKQTLPDKKFLTQNLPMAAVGTIAGGPIAGMAMGAMPPQNATDALLSGAGVGMGGALSKVEGAIQALGNPFKRFAARAAVGLASEQGNNAVRTGMGEEAPSGIVGNLMAALLPGVAGHLIDKIPANANAIEAKSPIGQTAAKITNNPAISSIGDYEQGAGAGSQHFDQLQAQQAKQGMQQTAQQVPEAAFLQQQKQQAQQQASQMYQQNAQRLTQENNDIVTAPQYSSPSDTLQKKAFLSKTSALQKQYEKLGQASDPDAQELNALYAQKAEIQGSDQGPFKDASFKKAQTQAIQDQIDSKVFGVYQKQVAQTQQAAEAQIQNLYNPKLAGVQRLQNVTDSVSSALDKDMILNVPLKVLTTPQGGKFNSQVFVHNILGADSDSIDELYKYLGKQPNGDSMIQTTRDALLTEFFAQAYDPKTKQLSNMNKLVQPDGPFNNNKMRSIFGSGVEGDTSTSNFDQFLNDLDSLQKLQTSSQQEASSGKKPNFGHMSWLLTPTGLGYLGAHMAGQGYGTSIATGLAIGGAANAAKAGANMVYKSWVPIADKVISNPRFASSFHSAIAKGDVNAIQQALQVIPSATSTSNKD